MHQRMLKVGKECQRWRNLQSVLEPHASAYKYIEIPFSFRACKDLFFFSIENDFWLLSSADCVWEICLTLIHSMVA